MAQAFALLREHSPHLVQIIDASRQVVFQNETLRKLRLAANLPDSNKAAGQILHPEDREQSLRKLDLLFETGEYTDVVFRVRQLDGSYRAMLASAEPVRDASGRVSHAVAILVHIEAQLRAERERDEKSAFFEAVANVAGDLVLVIDTQGKIVYQNEALKKIRRGRGFADEQSWGQLIHPDDLELTRAAVAQGLAGAPRSALQYRVAGPGGGWRVLQANTQPILDDQGQPQFLAAVAIDITDQLEQEKKLRQMEIAAARADADQRLGAVLSQGVLGVAEVDLNGIIRSANQALCRLTGYTKDELIGRNWTLFYRPEDQAEFNQRLAVTARGESVEPVRREFLRADRTVGWWIGTIVGISDSQGAPLGAYMLMFDAAAQAQAENALAESEELYRLITDNQSELVQMTDREGKVLFESPSVSRLRAASDLRSSLRLGDPRTTLIHPDDVRIAMEAVAEIFRDRKPITMELRQMLPSGQIRWVEANGQPILGPDGEVEKVLTVSRDITDRKLAEQQREEALNQARQANQAKTRFLAKVSHELRTPLNAVLGYGYLLGQSGLDAKQAEQLGQIVRSSQHLLRLISDVLDLSRIEAGEQAVELAPFSLTEVLDGAMNAVRPQARQRNNALICEKLPNLPRQLMGDAALIEQVLLNLLSNAVKFTEQGRITLRVSQEPAQPWPPDAVWLRIEVQDTGVGIAPDKLDGLFQAFSQVMPDRRGTGLGLEISRQLIELMGGKVGVQSQPGRGSCFWFTVPLAQAPTEASPPESAPGTAPHEDALEQLRARHRGAKILVADDDPINQQLMILLLERAGLAAQIADDGERALQMARAELYPVAILDLQMPELDGIEATRAIRQLPQWQRVPIVALTADVFTETRQACLAAGMTEFLGKPVQPEILYPLLLQLLDKPPS